MGFAAGLTQCEVRGSLRPGIALVVRKTFNHLESLGWRAAVAQGGICLAALARHFFLMARVFLAPASRNDAGRALFHLFSIFRE